MSSLMVSRIGARDAAGAQIGYFERAGGACGLEEAARGLAFIGMRLAARQEAGLMALHEGGGSIDGHRPLLEAVEAFCRPLDKAGTAEARVAMERGRPELAALARLVCSLEKVARISSGFDRPGAFIGRVAEGLLPPEWRFRAGKAPDCQAWISESESWMSTLSVEAADGGAFARAAAAANALCAPFAPVESEAGPRGASLSLDTRLAWSCAVGARLAGCAWARPWAESELSWSDMAMSDRRSIRLWMDAPDPWGEARKPAVDAASWRPAAAEGVWSPSLLAAPMSLAVGVNAGARLALSGDARLERLASSTLLSWARRAQPGQVARAVESMLAEGAHVPAVSRCIAPILARIQSAEMLGIVGASPEASEAGSGGDAQAARLRL